MTSPLWYCARNGHTYGPFDADALRSLVLQSRVHPTDAISNGGAWFSAATIPGLFATDGPFPTVTPVAPMPLALPSMAAPMPVAAILLAPPAALLPPRPVPAYASAPAAMMAAGGFPVAATQPVAESRPLGTSWRTAAPWMPGSSFRSKATPWVLAGIALLLVMWLWGVWTLPLAAVPV